jgi:hypothetical protein
VQTNIQTDSTRTLKIESMRGNADVSAIMRKSFLQAIRVTDCVWIDVSDGQSKLSGSNIGFTIKPFK